MEIYKLVSKIIMHYHEKKMLQNNNNQTVLEISLKTVLTNSVYITNKEINIHYDL